MSFFSNKKEGQYNPYHILGIDRRASMAEIKKAYFKLVRLYPPEEDAEKFKQIREAYEQLKDQEKRAEIDLFLLQPPPELPNYRLGNYDFSVHNEDIVSLAVETKLEEISVKEDFKILKI